MQEIIYHTNFQLEDNYWWFVARNNIVKEIVNKYCFGRIDGYLIDIGCGTGGFLKLLAKDYKVIGMDTSGLALEYAKKRGLEKLFQGRLDEFQAKDYFIQCALMLDVIEHIEDDNDIVSQVFNLLPSGGWFIATVPAYQWMWSHHDVKHMHYRRYTKSNFVKLLKNNGFEIEFSTYFNSFLFPIAALKRIMDKLLGDKNPDSAIDEVSPLINRIFTKIFLSEKLLLKFMRFPFGVSIMVAARKK